MAQPLGSMMSDPDNATTSSSEDVVSKEKLTDFISSLPTKDGWSVTLIQYKNYWFRPKMLEGILLDKQGFIPRPDDIILTTQLKCGTTWLKALAFTITNRCRHSFGDHPLLTRHPHHLVPSIEFPIVGSDFIDIDALPSPRLLGTHMPMSLLPPSTSMLGCRVVYLCRDPKDALVSRLHFENKVGEGSIISMDSAFSMFCEGFSPFGPFWDHCLEYWKESVARPDNILFLKYEELKSDPVQVVRRPAEFLGVPLTEEEEKSGVAQEVVRLCSFEMLTSLEVNQLGAGHRGYFSNSVFYRKGEVGDWKNHMSDEMGETMDGIVREKLEGSGLVF